VTYKKEYLNLFSSNNHEQTHGPRVCQFNSSREPLLGNLWEPIGTSRKPLGNLTVFWNTAADGTPRDRCNC